jgi:hypothetical protein
VRACESCGFKLLSDRNWWQRARPKWAVRKGGRFAADRNRSVDLLKDEVIAGLESFERARWNMCDERAAFRNDYSTLCAAALGEIERAADLREGRWFKRCAVGEDGLARAFHRTTFRERE